MCKWKAEYLHHHHPSMQFSLDKKRRGFIAGREEASILANQSWLAWLAQQRCTRQKAFPQRWRMQIKNNFILTGGNLDDNVFSLKKKNISRSLKYVTILYWWKMLVSKVGALHRLTAESLWHKVWSELKCKVRSHTKNIATGETSPVIPSVDNFHQLITSISW